MNDDDERCVEYVRGYKPVVYEASNDDVGYKSVDGTNVKPVRVKSLSSYVKEWGDVGGHYYCGDIPENLQFIEEHYKSDTIDYDLKKIAKCYFDIEVIDETGTAGFPEPWEAATTVTSIAAYFDKTKKMIVLDTKGGYKVDPSNPNIVYHTFDNEVSMLEYWWSLINMDVSMLIGWNSSGFDIPYLVNRSINLGIDVEQLLPLKDLREGFDKVDNQKTYQIAGLIHYDYMGLVRKYMPEKQESYSLDYISKKFLDEGKVSYLTDHGSLQNLYKNDYQTFIDYNMKDVMLMVDLDNRLQLIKQIVELAYFAKIPPREVYSSMKLWDSIIYSTLKKEGIIVPRRNAFNMSNDEDGYLGAYVKEPLPGMYEWVASFDLNSLYPNIMISWNMSSMNIIDDANLHEDLWKLKQKYKFDRTSLETSAKSVDKIINDEVDLSALKKHNVSMALNGTFYDNSKQDYVNTVVDNIFQRRMALKKRNAELKRIGGDKEEIERNKNIIWGLKIAINSYYGCVGNQHFRYYNRDVAEGVTVTGQYIVRKIGGDVERSILNKIGQDNTLKYSDTDSVVGDTIINTNNGDVAIEELYNRCNNKREYNDGKFIGDMKDYSSLSFNINSNVTEHKSIKYVMKHRVKKKMYKMSYNGKSVTMTEDHSVMIKRNGNIIDVSSKDIIKGDKIIFIKNS